MSVFFKTSASSSSAKKNTGIDSQVAFVYFVSQSKISYLFLKVPPDIYLVDCEHVSATSTLLSISITEPGQVRNLTFNAGPTHAYLSGRSFWLYLSALRTMYLLLFITQKETCTIHRIPQVYKLYIHLEATYNDETLERARSCISVVTDSGVPGSVRHLKRYRNPQETPSLQKDFAPFLMKQTDLSIITLYDLIVKASRDSKNCR